MCIFQSCVCICQNLHVVNSKEVKSIYLYIETREPLPRGAEEALNSLFNLAAPPYHTALNKAKTSAPGQNATLVGEKLSAQLTFFLKC